MLRRALDLRIKKPGYLVLICQFWNLEGLAETNNQLPLKPCLVAWTLSCALGHDRVGSEFLNNLFGNSVEGGLKEKHWIGGKEVVKI